MSRSEARRSRVGPLKLRSKFWVPANAKPVVIYRLAVPLSRMVLPGFPPAKIDASHRSVGSVFYSRGELENGASGFFPTARFAFASKPRDRVELRTGGLHRARADRHAKPADTDWMWELSDYSTVKLTMRRKLRASKNINWITITWNLLRVFAIKVKFQKLYIHVKCQPAKSVIQRTRRRSRSLLGLDSARVKWVVVSVLMPTGV